MRERGKETGLSVTNIRNIVGMQVHHKLTCVNRPEG